MCWRQGSSHWCPLTVVIIVDQVLGLSWVEGSPQRFPLQCSLTVYFYVLFENIATELAVRTRRRDRWLNGAVMATFSSSWSCLFIRVFQCSKSSMSWVWMSFKVPSLSTEPSFMARIWTTSLRKYLDSHLFERWDLCSHPVCVNEVLKFVGDQNHGPFIVLQIF